MTLKNLLGISLDEVAPDRTLIAKLLSAARRNIADAQLPALTFGLPQNKVILLDALRKQRNLSDYSGDPISETVATECLDSARDLLAHMQAWLERHRPDLL